MVETKIRILCVEDHLVVRQGIAALLQSETDMQIVAFAATGYEAIEQFRQHRPDVTLMDLQLPAMDGFEATRAIRREHSDARIVVLTMYQGSEDIYRALQAGAITYLFKTMLADELVRVIRDVHTGGGLLPKVVDMQLATRSSLPALTGREVEVLELLATGMSDKEVGTALGITEGSVHVHVRNIFAKLDVHARTAAVAIAARRGIIHL